MMPGKVPLLPLSVEKEDEKKKQQQHDPPFLPGVPHVIMWALFNAGCFAFSITYALLIVTGITQPPSWLLLRRGPELTDGAADVVLVAGVLWCVCIVFQAAAGVLALALALPRHRRLLLAYAALVATAAGHSLWAALHSVFVAADGGLCFRTGVTTAAIFFAGVVDVVCFRGLILGAAEE